MSASDSLVHVHHLRVRYAETDQMGVAHHASYVPWIEEARTEWMRARGRSYRALEEQGLALAVTRLSLRYLRSAEYDDLLCIRTRLEAQGMASLDFAYDIELCCNSERSSSVLLATASTRLALLGEDGRPRRLPAELF